MPDPIDFDALGRIGLGPAQRRQLAYGVAQPLARPMRLVQVQRDHLLLHDGHHTHRGHCAPALLRDLASQSEALAVGDWVLAEPVADGGWRIGWRLLPSRQIARRTLDGRAADGHRAAQRQVLVSNVDTAVLVMGLDGDFNPRRLERYLALVRLAGVATVLVLSKADTVGAERCAERLAQARAVLPAGVAVMALDLRQPAAAQALQPCLQPGQTLVLLGSSGAGKSTLANTLLNAPIDAPVQAQPVPQADASGGASQRTGAARVDDSRGRHTTTVRTLLPLPGGACLIDTPGLRALRLDVADPEDLAQAFGDVARLATLCRFRDCQHQSEPACAVRQALAAPRLQNFHKLLRESGRDALDPVQRQARLAGWKARSRDVQMRLRAKRDGDREKDRETGRDDRRKGQREGPR